MRPVQRSGIQHTTLSTSQARVAKFKLAATCSASSMHKRAKPRAMHEAALAENSCIELPPVSEQQRREAQDGACEEKSAPESQPHNAEPASEALQKHESADSAFDEESTLEKQEDNSQSHTTSLYQPLQHASSIRLLLLLPSLEDDVIRCHIVPADIDDAPPFATISYVWGDENRRVTILCNDTPVSITESLADALRRFRDETLSAVKVPLYWADALCINQLDIQEREQQVRIMAKIYSRASLVLIWLGHENDDSDLAIDYMYTLIQQIRPHLAEFLNWQARYQLVENEAGLQLQDPGEVIRRFGLKPADATEYAAMEHLFRRPWFKRAWTFQESYLARKRIFTCGESAIDGDFLHLVQLILMNLARHTSDCRYFANEHQVTFGRLDNKCFGNAPDMTMLQLVERNTAKLCKHPSDLIYSVLGSAVDGEMFNVDYSISWQQVFANFVVHQVIISHNLNILGYLSGASTDLPTWVPDWRSFTYRNQRHFSNIGKYRSAGSTKPVLSTSHDGRYLKLRGIALDVISHVTDLSQATSLKDLVTFDDIGYLYTGEPWVIVISRCRWADLKGWQHDLQDFDIKRLTLDDIFSIPKLEGTERAAYAQRCLEFNARKNIVATKQKRLGMVPEQARVGDVICIMAGGAVPFILRPNEGVFELVGECYLHGCMDGEYFEIDQELVEECGTFRAGVDVEKELIVRELRDFILC